MSWELSISMKLFKVIFSTYAFWNVHRFELQLAGAPPNNLFSHQIIILKTRRTLFSLVWMSNIVNNLDLSNICKNLLWFQFILSIWFHLLYIYHLYMFENRVCFFSDRKNTEKIITEQFEKNYLKNITRDVKGRYN